MISTNDLKRKLDKIQASDNLPAVTYTPQFKDRGISHRQIKKHIFNCFNFKKFDELENNLKAFKLTEKDLEAFLVSEHGKQVLSKALVLSSTEESLAFLIKLVPKNILVNAFKENGYKLLYTFIDTELEMVSNGWANGSGETDKFNQVQIQKFNLLLSLDKEGIQIAFKEYEPQEKITKNMRDNFETALKMCLKEEDIAHTRSKI